MKKKVFVFWMTILLVICLGALESLAQNKPITLRISSGVGPKHCWTAGHLDIFASAIEKETGGRIKFNRYYAGELCSVGKSFECLKGGMIDVSDPFLSPYHAGLFPLSEVSMLPVVNTDSFMVTRAYQKLMDSKVPLKDNKTFYELEWGSKGLKAWPLGPTEGYSLSTTGLRFNKPEDFGGVPMRAGARLHLMLVKALGAVPVNMPGMEMYEAFSRGTIKGSVLSIPDWKAYGFQELIRYTAMGMNLGHFPGYLLMTQQSWEKLPPDTQKIWDRVARETAFDSAECWNSKVAPTMKESKEKYGAVFEDYKDLNPSVQKAITDACILTWKTWMAEEEEKGNPARATAKLWSQFVIEEGGMLPKGVKELLK
jgi:TRAP-type C4-dicarboxylate transport system substrate-binding protein